jgi:hypothetical protein
MTSVDVASTPTLRDKARKFLLDPYLDWAEAQGVPIHEDFAVDMLKVEAKPWARFGVNGAICHVKGRDDFLTTFLYELPPGGASAPTRHIYEEVVYVLSGRGSTTVETPTSSPTSPASSSRRCRRAARAERRSASSSPTARSAATARRCRPAPTRRATGT